MNGLTLDAGALIAFDRNNRKLVGLLARSLELGYSLAVPAGVVAQVWRDGRRQARLARLLGSPDLVVESLDDQRAREAGQLCGARGTADVVDASLVLCAKARGHGVVTGDSEDIRALDAAVPIIVV